MVLSPTPCFRENKNLLLWFLVKFMLEQNTCFRKFQILIDHNYKNITWEISFCKTMKAQKILQAADNFVSRNNVKKNNIN